MDFSFWYQLREKRLWWVDALFYLSLGLVIALGLAYGLLVWRSAALENEIQETARQLAEVGTVEQKVQEAVVLEYQKKLNDFNELFKNNGFASNVFAFAQDRALPYTWFKQFILSQGNATVQFFGETDTADNMSRQVAQFEADEYVAKVTLLNSRLDVNGKLGFNISLALDQNIFAYRAVTDLPEIEPIPVPEETPQPETEALTPPEQP